MTTQEKQMSTNNLLECPNCGGFIVIQELNCGIFRHGIMKNNGKQINPHLGKIECDDLLNKNLIEGCGKPFKVIKNNDTFNVIKCDYI